MSFSAPTAAIAVRHLAKSYEGSPAVNDVSFEVRAGEIFGLLGANGAGKTTILECIAGLREPDEGEIQVAGFDLRREPRRARQALGVVLQSTGLQDQITPREALRLQAALHGRTIDSTALLQRFSLGEKADARFGTLSGGQRQRLALALAFVHAPQILVLDEPTAGLDPTARQGLHDEIFALRRAGHAVLLATHYLEEAEKLCDRVAVLHRGRVAVAGATRELMVGAVRRQRVTLTCRPLPSRSSLDALPGVTVIELEDDTVRFQADDVAAMLAALAELIRASGAEVIDLQVQHASLDEVFARLDGDSGGEGTGS